MPLSHWLRVHFDLRPSTSKEAREMGIVGKQVKELDENDAKEEEEEEEEEEENVYRVSGIELTFGEELTFFTLFFLHLIILYCWCYLSSLYRFLRDQASVVLHPANRHRFHHRLIREVVQTLKSTVPFSW